jgi:hypothetical protein
MGESTNWEIMSRGLSTPVKRIPLGIRAYGEWRIAGSKDDHSPFPTIRYWLYAICSFSSDEIRATRYELGMTNEEGGFLERLKQSLGNF